MKHLALLATLAASACTPAVSVVVYADTPERAEQLAATVARAETAFDGAVMFDVDVGDLRAPREHNGPSDALGPLTRADTIPVYLMSEIEGPDTYAIGVSHREDCHAAVGIRVGFQSDDRLMAHEFGHVFGLDHRPEQHNIMSTDAHPGATFDGSQIDTVHENAFVRCGWMDQR